MTTDNRTTRLEAYREKSIHADSLASSGKIYDALALLRECLDEAAQEEDEDYRLFFEAELLGYTTPDFLAQITLLEKALAWMQDRSQQDYFLIRNLGIYHSQNGDEKGAIEYFDRALAIKPEDVDALRNKGVSLSKMGDMKGAIEYFDRALAIKPEDADALRQKGVSLSCMGE